MCTASFIRRHIFFLPEGTLFTTRDLLSYGRRAAVDAALHRLVKSGAIRRLARGVFVQDFLENMQFSYFQIATAKAKAFGRRLAVEPDVTARANLLPSKSSENQTVFFTDGRSTSFHIGNQLIQLKQNAPRKISMGVTKAGIYMRSLWQLGQEAVTDRLVLETTKDFRRSDRFDLRNNACWMPLWLSDRFNFGQRWVPIGPAS